MTSREPLTAAEISDRLTALPMWRFEGDALVRTVRVDYAAGARIVVEVADICEELDHHADIDLRYGSVRIASTTHDRGRRVTAWDVELATRIDRALARHPVD